MEFQIIRNDALSNISHSNFLCCPNCESQVGIEILGMRSHAKPHPKIKSYDHILDYSLWFYCRSCFTEFGSVFTHKTSLGVSCVTVHSSIQQIVHKEKQEEKDEKPTRKAVPARLRYETLKKHNHQCQSCGATVEDGAKLEVDHIVPVSKGGTNEPENLQVLCKTCNIGKSDKY